MCSTVFRCFTDLVNYICQQFNLRSPNVLEFLIGFVLFSNVRSTGHSWPQMVHPPSQIPNHEKAALKNIHYGRKSKGNFQTTLTIRSWWRSLFFITLCKHLVMQLYEHIMYQKIILFTLHDSLHDLNYVVLNHSNVYWMTFCQMHVWYFFCVKLLLKWL